MRKLYALLVGLIIGLTGIQATPRPFTADVANFTFTIDATNHNVFFVNTSVLGNEPGDRKAYWNFGDGVILQTPPLAGTQHHYNNIGTYTVCLSIYRYRSNPHDSVLSAQICKTVVIQDSCRADFERIQPNSSANPLTVTYKALPWHHNNNRPARICWQFGDGRDTCIPYLNVYHGQYTVTHTYAYPGLYEVCVKILYQGGCEARKCKTLQVGRLDTCGADFERVQSSANNPLQAYFVAIPHHNNNRKPARVCWQFGDGQDTCINYAENYTGQYVVGHRYDHPGQYEVCVKINYYGGCEARKCKMIIIARPDTCGANFERIQVNTTTNPLQAYYRALLSHNNNRKPARICWQFGDGLDTCINYPENYTGQYVVGHRYAQRGLYEVCVKILYYGGCEARKCDHIQIGDPDHCTADFEKIISPTSTPLQTYFRALPWNDNNRKPARICWQFGDGQDTCINYAENYTGQYVVGHHYDHPGQYEVCIKINYYGGCEARKCKIINVEQPNNSCTVHLFEIAPSITSLTREFVAVPASTPVRRPIKVCWYFGDGQDTCIVFTNTTPPPQNLTIQHTYTAPGVYNACVKVFFDGGCIAQDCREVVIRATGNVCGGYMIDSLIAPRTFRFRGFSIHAQNDDAISFRWTFGDGAIALGREVTHTYSQGGNYEVCLVIKTRLGCETRICKTIHIPVSNQPILNLSPNPVINVLHVDFFSTQTEQVNVKIFNATGTPVRSYVRNVTAGPNSWNIDLSTLLPGVYSFVIQSPNQLASAIFLKQ